MHLKSSPKNTLQFEAQKTQELIPENSPLSQLVLKRPVPLHNHQYESIKSSDKQKEAIWIIGETKLPVKVELTSIWP